MRSKEEGIWDGVINCRSFRLVHRVVTLRRVMWILVIFVLVSEFGFFPQLVKRGYYCDDRSIQRPFTGDTVATSVIIMSGFVPLLLIWITEVIFYSPSSSLLSSRSSGTSTRWSGSWNQSWYWIKKYGKGLILKILIVDIIKTFAGEHRPHFIETCLPDITCEGSEYVSTYTCTNTDYRPYFIRDASKSFPSGHSSVSVYGSIFMIWYLQKRCPKMGSIIALPLCQVVVATWGIFCSLSRIIDNRHHWWDVLAGAFIGVVAAYLTCYFSCHNFDRSRLRAKEPIYKDHDINLVSNSVPYLPASNGVNGTASS